MEEGKGMAAWFVHPRGGMFSSRYRRTVANGGRTKRVHCFPVTATDCRGTVLVGLAPELMALAESGCCGEGIIASSSCTMMKRGLNSKVIGVARFFPVDEKEMVGDKYFDGMMWYQVGERYSRDAILHSVRSNHSPHRPDILGKFVAQKKGIEFFSQVWHYGWLGGRYKTHLLHQFEVLVFVVDPIPGNMNLFECVAKVQSTKFSIYSGRSYYSADPETMIFGNGPNLNDNLTNEMDDANWLGSTTMESTTRQSSSITKPQNETEYSSAAPPVKKQRTSDHMIDVDIGANLDEVALEEADNNTNRKMTNLGVYVTSNEVMKTFPFNAFFSGRISKDTFNSMFNERKREILRGLGLDPDLCSILPSFQS